MCWILISFETMRGKDIFFKLKQICSDCDKYNYSCVISLTVIWCLFQCFVSCHSYTSLYYSFLFFIYNSSLAFMLHPITVHFRGKENTFCIFYQNLLSLYCCLYLKDSSLDARCYWKTPSLMILLKDNLATCYNQLLKFIVTVLNIVHWLWHWLSTN